jgi:hypothetical protein
MRPVQARAPEPVHLHQVGDGPVRGGPQEQVARHPQVQGQGPVALEMKDQVLAPAPHRLDRAPGQRPLDQLRRDRPGQALVEDLHGIDSAPGHLGRELATNRLYLGELGHLPGG